MTDKPHEFSESVCSCEICQSMCLVPCIPSPEEADRLMDNGYGLDLMKREVFISYPLYSDVSVVCPANPDQRGKYNPNSCRGGCVFQLENGLCKLHGPRLKPVEGRLATHDRESCKGLHEYVAELWNSEAGSRAVERFDKFFLESDGNGNHKNP